MGQWFGLRLKVYEVTSSIPRKANCSRASHKNYGAGNRGDTQNITDLSPLDVSRKIIDLTIVLHGWCSQIFSAPV